MYLGGLNLLICDLTAATTAVTAVVPVKRSFEGTKGGDAGATLAKTGLLVGTGLSADGGALDAWAL